jgi:diacylglycerol kinase (ATP)
MSRLPYLAVVNPAAGGGRCGRQCQAGLEQLRAGGIEVDVIETSAAGQASDIVRLAYREGRRRFIAVGGDGTSYEIVNGLFPEASEVSTPERPSLGFLPMGTGNSFLRDFTEDGASYSIEAITQGRRRRCDVIRLEHADGVLHYINLLSIGFVADVNGLRARRFSRWGELGYIAAVVTEVARLRSRAFPMIVDGVADGEPMVFASFNNSRFTGGKMMMAPEAEIDDGRIALVRVAPLGRWNLLRTFPKIFKGTHVQHRAVHTAKIETVEFELDDEIDVMVDGEALRVVPRALRVLAGALDVDV